MRRGAICITAIVISIIGILSAFAAQDPVKWSAPLNQYPNQWSPSAQPPAYSDPYGYQYYYNPYGYGAYGGNYQGSYGAAQQGNSGNPFYYYGY